MVEATRRTMRAARAHPGQQVMRLEAIDVPRIENDDVLVLVLVLVLVRVAATGITRALIGMWRREKPAGEQARARRLLAPS